MKSVHHGVGFEAIAHPGAKVLILGSLPGQRSLADSEYYAFPGNAFWPILAKITEVPANASYETRCTGLQRAGIALWDVLAQAVRPGSLDSAIRRIDAEPNDFQTFLSTYREIRAVFFNGKAAADFYASKVVPQLEMPFQDLPREVLPSTSPAHAAMTHCEKGERWLAALQPWLAVDFKPSQ